MDLQLEINSGLDLSLMRPLCLLFGMQLTPNLVPHLSLTGI